MDREPTPSSAGSRLSRRGLLAVAGTTALAGCSRLGEFGGESAPTIDAYDLPDTGRRGVRDRDRKAIVPESVPVEIAPAHFTAARDRVTSLLGDLPTPLGPEEIPNGYVRQQLVEAATNAADGLSHAQGAPTEFVALTALQDARAEARYAAAGWAVVEEDRSVDALREEYRGTVADAESAREGHEYVGDDPVRAALVHSRIEGLLARVTEGEEPRPTDNRLLAVAEWGKTAESGRAHLDDARHLDEQFTASLPDSAGTIEGTLRAAAETRFADAQSRRADLPPEPTAEEWGVAELGVGELRQEVKYGPTGVTDAAGVASAVVAANRQLTRFEALERLQDRIDDGESFRPESADDVRELRSNAYDALETALAESSAPELTRTAITNAGWRVAQADWDLSQHEGEIPATRLDRTVAEYVVATVVGQAAPAVSEATVGTLGDA